MVPRTVVRFLAVGVCNTLIDVVLFWVLHAPLGIVLANFVSTSAGMTFSFLVNGRHTFGAERATVRQAVLFVAANGATMWVLQPALINAMHDLASMPLMVAKVFALGGSVVANFLLYRYVVWPDRSAEPDAAGGEPRSGPLGLDTSTDAVPPLVEESALALVSKPRDGARGLAGFDRAG